MQANIFDKNGALIAPVLDSIIQGDEALNTANFDVFLNDVLALMETGWQQANLRQANADNQLVARILFKDHKDWIAKQIALSKLLSHPHVRPYLALQPKMMMAIPSQRRLFRLK